MNSARQDGLEKYNHDIFLDNFNFDHYFGQKSHKNEFFQTYAWLYFSESSRCVYFKNISKIQNGSKLTKLHRFEWPVIFRKVSKICNFVHFWCFPIIFYAKNKKNVKMLKNESWQKNWEKSRKTKTNRSSREGKGIMMRVSMTRHYSSAKPYKSHHWLADIRRRSQKKFRKTWPPE